MPFLYVVILAWNRCDETLACLDSLMQSTYTGFRTLVVDNGSTDGTPTAIRAAFPQVEVIEIGQNKGFAGGANIGLRHVLEAGADHVLLVNNDTVMHPQMLEHLMAHTGPDVGMLSPLIYYAGMPDVIWSAGALRHPLTLERIKDMHGQHDDGHWPQTVERDFLPGCAALIARSALEAVELFDERFFMYYEDHDWCLRAQRAGFRLLLVPQAKIWHKVAISSGGRDSPAERYAMARSSVLFFRKYTRGWRWLIIGPYRLGSAVKTTLRLLFRRRIKAAKAYWRGLQDGLAAKPHSPPNEFP
jgi:GT2 family glycosyltransferase